MVAGEKPLGREEQFDAIQGYIGQCLAKSKGGLIYATGISGTGLSHGRKDRRRMTGTLGKSVTVHSVMAGLWKYPSPFEAPPALVSINCMSLTTPKAVYEAIWNGYEMHSEMQSPAEIAYPCRESAITIGISKYDIIKEEMTTFVNSEVPTESKTAKHKSGKKRDKTHQDDGQRSMLIVFLDEIDKLIGGRVSTPLLSAIVSDRDTVQNIELLLNLFSMAVSSKRLVLIGAANTLDLTDRWMEDFDKAECLPELVSFPAYRPTEVSAVLKKLATQSEDPVVLTDRAIEFLARRACSTGMGDMRGVFHICQSALATFEKRKTLVASGSKSAALEESGDEWVGIKEITEVFNKLHTGTDNEPYSAVSSLPLDQQVLLLAVVQLLQGHRQRCDKDSPERQRRKKCTSHKGRRENVGLDVEAIYQQCVVPRPTDSGCALVRVGTSKHVETCALMRIRRRMY